MIFYEESSTERLEKRLLRLYDQERELQSHPAFPCISDIPGYIALQESIDELESELAERAVAEWV